MFFKSNLFYFVLQAKGYSFCLQAQPVLSDYILNVLETVKFVFCLHNTRTMYNELKILYTAFGPGGLMQYTKFFVHCTFSLCVNL